MAIPVPYVKIPTTIGYWEYSFRWFGEDDRQCHYSIDYLDQNGKTMERVEGNAFTDMPANVAAQTNNLFNSLENEFEELLPGE
jgi:hypothetical protein